MRAISEGEMVVLVLTREEAWNIGHRLNCSSFSTFDSYRERNGISGLSRNPLASNLKACLSGCDIDISGQK
jgi:hypothetical protein